MKAKKEWAQLFLMNVRIYWEDGGNTVEQFRVKADDQYIAANLLRDFLENGNHIFKIKSVDCIWCKENEHFIEADDSIDCNPSQINLPE